MNITLLIAIPLITAFVSILSKKIAPYMLILVALFNVVSLDFYSKGAVYIGNFAAPFGIELVLDNLSLLALYVVNILFFLVVVINYREFKKLSSILLVALAGLNGLLLTGDLFNLFVFLEITAIAGYLITTTNKKPLATFHYLVVGTVGSSLYLLGLIILYSMFGTLNMSDLSTVMNSGNMHVSIVAIPFLLMFIGFGVEVKLLPFNAWVKNILGTSNTLSGPMIASVYASAMAFVFGRLLTEVFIISDSLMMIITIILVVSITAGEAMAYASTKVKDIMLYSSIAQAAIAVMVFTLGYTGFGVLLVSLNGFSKLVLFLVITIAEKQTGSDEIEDLKGIFAENKLIGIGFTIASLSMLGLPLFAGFIVKMNILINMIDSAKVWMVVVILASSVVEGVYFVKLLTQLWHSESAQKVQFSVQVIYTVIVISFLLVLFGVYTAPLTDYANSLVQVIGGGF
jgi:multicomponent Na+:H+ antiporter subunit D